jgi:hypothetical protein
VQLESVRAERIATAETNCKTEIVLAKKEYAAKLKADTAGLREDLKAKKTDIRKACKNACTSWNRVLKSLEADATAGR